MPKRDSAPFDPRRLRDRKRPADVVSNVVDPRSPVRENGVTEIRVVGIGGAGNNAINRMVEAGVGGVEFIAVNSDAQDLASCLAGQKIPIGTKTTRNLGAGGNPTVGERAAFESSLEIESALEGADMVFVTAGMGGGTGTGGAPVVARIAKDSGALTVGVVTTPFGFEGVRRLRTAEEGIVRLKENVDTLLVIPNERLHVICQEQITADNAFRMADDVLRLGVQSIAELVTVPGDINLDFADVQAVMREAGPAWMSIGYGVGEDRAKDAAQQAISNPLLDVSIEGATGVLFNITGGSDLMLAELHEAAEVIQGVVDPDCNIIFGMASDPKMENEIKLTVIATGFPTTETIQEKEDNLNDMLQQALASGDSELDLPPFLRRLSSYRTNGHAEKAKVPAAS